jgi:hypothetical protein
MKSRKAISTTKSVLPSEKNGPFAASAGVAERSREVRVRIMRSSLQLCVDRRGDRLGIGLAAQRGDDGGDGVLGHASTFSSARGADLGDGLLRLGGLRGDLGVGLGRRLVELGLDLGLGLGAIFCASARASASALL